jgi:hypothetical protein
MTVCNKGTLLVGFARIDIACLMGAGKANEKC